MQGGLYAFDQNSKRETREKKAQEDDHHDDELYLAGKFSQLFRSFKSFATFS